MHGLSKRQDPQRKEIDMTRTTPRTRMIQAAAFVRANPGCAILPVAEAVGPHGSRNYGYRTVHRAIKAGLIRATVKAGRYSLTA